VKGTVRTYKAGGMTGVKSDDKQPNAKSPKKTVEKYNMGGAC